MDINWYPGHMAKAKRLLEEELRLVDIIIELLDARAPKSSINPDFEKLYRNKLRLIVLTKSDCADRNITYKWLKNFRDEGYNAIDVNSLDNNSMNAIKKWINGFCDEMRREYKERKGINKTIRAMVVGIPNVGKSTFINALSGGRRVKVGDKPGITKGKQWIRVHPYFELLDTPGILWPKLDDRQTALNLSYIGSIKAELIDFEELAINFIDLMKIKYPERILNYYGLEDLDNTSIEILYAICKKRSWLRSGGELDIDKGARQIIRDFQQGKLGRISLETP
ncbi:MAG TPA: ribosome biogenesis GTPase YlqF [Clostridiales bacterium]|nr:ribosome biogenesis GTPase YlqF [Clostridiales bacterium]